MKTITRAVILGATSAILVGVAVAGAGVVPIAPVPVGVGDPSVSGGVSDLEIEQAVESALVLNARVDLSGVAVESRGGVVTLTGTVINAEARRAASVAALAAGALEVRNLLRVASP